MGELAKWRAQNWVRIGSDGNIKGACGTSKNKKNLIDVYLCPRLSHYLNHKEQLQPERKESRC